MDKQKIMAENSHREPWEFGKPIPGYLEMKETKILENGQPKTITAFEKEEEISELDEASKHSLAYLEMGGIDLTSRSEMPKFFRFDITTNSAKEALEQTRDYLDYLQAEAKAEAAAAKENKGKITFENNPES